MKIFSEGGIFYAKENDETVHSDIPESISDDADRLRAAAAQGGGSSWDLSDQPGREPQRGVNQMGAG